MTLSLTAIAAVAIAFKNPSEPELLTHPTGDRITTFLLQGRPHGVGVAPNGTFYITQIDGDAVMRGTVTADSEVFTGQLAVGSAPAHIAIDSHANYAYTTNQYGNSVSVVDVTTNSRTGDVPLTGGGGFNLLVSPDGTRVWATTSGGTLNVIDATTRQVVATVPVGASANGLAYDARSKTLYVSSIGASTITAIDATTNIVKRTYFVGGMPQRIVLSPDGAELYVASEHRGLEVLTLASGAVSIVSVVPQGAVGMALSPDGAHLYVTNPPAGTVHVVDRATRQLVRVHSSLGSPRNVAFDARGTTAVITNEFGFVHFIR